MCRDTHVTNSYRIRQNLNDKSQLFISTYQTFLTHQIPFFNYIDFFLELSKCVNYASYDLIIY